ncbi:MAG: carboxylating nicotinate-nucleotide diphosphorylase [Verrucomicrobiota bacterium]
MHDPIALALAEDIGIGDVTAEFFVENRLGKARLFAKGDAIAAGVETAAEVFHRVDSRTETTIIRPSGSRLKFGDSVLEIEGLLPSLLSAERVALNFLQHLSGIATLTSRFVAAVAGTKARILDTRKTVPCLRLLEKAAVVSGGGTNHRMGLYDMAMVKDNHLAAGTTPQQLQSAIDRLRRERPGVRVEMEADTLAQVSDFLGMRGIDVILLDNMSLEEMRAAAAMAASVAPEVLLEASGGVTLETVASIAATGVDFISVGALTHSARAIDFSMELL